MKHNHSNPTQPNTPFIVCFLSDSSKSTQAKTEGEEDKDLIFITKSNIEDEKQWFCDEINCGLSTTHNKTVVLND